MITDRIEQVLRIWELNQASAKISIKRINMLKQGAANDEFVGPLKHYGTFRKDVLAGRPFDAEKYLPSGMSKVAAGTFGFFPAVAHAWAQSSRRIFTLDSTIQELIMQTNVSDLTWNDIVFPFAAFGIALARPIEEPNGQLFDFLLVHRGHLHAINRPGIAIWTLSKENDRPDVTTLKKVERAYDELVCHGRFRKSYEITNLMTSHQSAEKTSLGAKLNCFISDGAFFDQPLRDSFDYVKENEGKILDDGTFTGHVLPCTSFHVEALRLAAGLCVYLDTHRDNASVKVRTDWKPKENPTLDPNCITHEALVCTVQNVYDIHELERELLMILDPVERKRRCDELGVHYREGHTRKMPGMGHIKDAPRVVHVRPSIIGLRRMTQGSLPPGVAKVL